MKRIFLLLALCFLTGCASAAVSDSSSSTAPADSSSAVSSAESAHAVDYDLTVMSSDMVYATIYQMITEPEQYAGKTIRMQGLYYAAYAEQKFQYYHYCIVTDALACCAQGIEFVWDDGNHVYPDEYPRDNAPITVQGTFSAQKEETTGNWYCRLENASLNVNE